MCGSVAHRPSPRNIIEYPKHHAPPERHIERFRIPWCCQLRRSQRTMPPRKRESAVWMVQLHLRPLSSSSRMLQLYVDSRACRLRRRLLIGHYAKSQVRPTPERLPIVADLHGSLRAQERYILGCLVCSAAGSLAISRPYRAQSPSLIH